MVILTQWNTADINRLEPNGSTSLHAASFYGHKTIVQMLLQHDAEPRTMNKYYMTPYEEAANDEIRSLFRRPVETSTNRFTDDDRTVGCLELIFEEKIEENYSQVPNGWINGYKNIGKYFRSKNIKQIVRTPNHKISTCKITTIR